MFYFERHKKMLATNEEKQMMQTITELKQQLMEAIRDDNLDKMIEVLHVMRHEMDKTSLSTHVLHDVLLYTLRLDRPYMAAVLLNLGGMSLDKLKIRAFLDSVFLKTEAANPYPIFMEITPSNTPKSITFLYNLASTHQYSIPNPLRRTVFFEEVKRQESQMLPMEDLDTLPRCNANVAYQVENRKKMSSAMRIFLG